MGRLSARHGGHGALGRRAALGAIVLAGAVLRLVHLDFGLPSIHHPDEAGAAQIVHRCARGLVIEDQRHRHPPLLKNLACLVERGFGETLREASAGAPSAFLSLRVVSAAFGALAPLFVYALARRFVTVPAALLAAAIMACFPAAVIQSKYGTPDSLLVTLVLAALWLHVRMTEGVQPSRWLLAALVTSLAVAAKYNGALLAFPFVAAHLMACPSGGWRGLVDARLLAATAAGIALGVAAGFPGIVFGGEFQATMAGALGEGAHLLEEGHYGMALGLAEGLGVFHFQYSVLPASGPALLAAIVAGAALMAARGGSAALVLFAFAAPTYAIVEVAYKVPPSYERYMLPLLGVYLVAAAVAVDGAARAVGNLASRRIATISERAIGTRDERRGGASGGRRLANATFLLAGAVCLLPALVRCGEVLAAMPHDTRISFGKQLTSLLPEGTTLFSPWRPMLHYYPRVPRELPWLAAQPSMTDRASPLPRHVLVTSLLYQRHLDHPDAHPSWTRFYRTVFEQGTLVAEANGGAGRYMFQNPTLRLYRLDPPRPGANDGKTASPDERAPADERTSRGGTLP